MFGSYRLDRISLDLDGLLFRIKYMVKHEKDLDKLPELRERFVEKALELRDVFGEFMLNFLCQIITIPAPHLKCKIMTEYICILTSPDLQLLTIFKNSIFLLMGIKNFMILVGFNRMGKVVTMLIW